MSPTLFLILIASSTVAHEHHAPRKAWSDFKETFEKVYDTAEEEQQRMKTFIDNYHRINRHNEEYQAGKQTYYLRLNQYSDMTENEFASKTGCYHRRSQNRTGATFLEPLNFKAPEELDWRKHTYVSDVLNQGNCGSCYAFSATGSLEAQMYRAMGFIIGSGRLSQQNIIDCSEEYGNNSCHGGSMDNVFNYIQKNGGLDWANTYPYEQRVGKCRYDPAFCAAMVTGHVDVTGRNAEKLKAAVASVGPVSVAVNAIHSFQFYGGGVYHDPKCNSTTLTHAVLVVGYGTDKAAGLDYWTIKNRYIYCWWGKSWGEEGYIRLARNKNNMCGVLDDPSYPLVPPLTPGKDLFCKPP